MSLRLRSILFAALALAVCAPAAFAKPAAALVRAKLPNGLTVLVQPSPRLPVVSFRLVARAGSVYDPAGKEGLARMTSELLTQGAGTRDAQQVADDIEFVGGSLEASSRAEQFTVSCGVLKKDFATGLGLFHDVIVKPAFAAEEFDRKREEALGVIASNRSEPSVIAEQAFAAYLWGESPLAHPAIGTESSVKALTRDDVAAFHRRYVSPDRSFLVVVGDVDAAATIATLRKAFADWKPSGEPLRDPYAAPAPVTARSVRVVDKPEATQAQIRIGCISVPRNHPDYEAMQVANTILGDGFTSRLINAIRVEKGLTYSISSRFPQYRAAGAFTISTFTRNEKLREILDATLAEVGKLVNEGPTTAELDKARNYLVGQYPLELQSVSDLATQIATVEFYGLSPDWIAKYGDRVRAVNMDDVKRVLRERFCADKLRIVVVTQAAIAKPALEGFAPVEVKPID
ncbi:MAG: pitrilysin family protein [Candidatus Eisenbacteria bacterium]